MKGQGSLEYLVIIAGVLSVAAIVTLFFTSAGSQSTKQQSIQQCYAAASECHLLRQGDDRIECPNLCSQACSDPRTGKDIKTGQIIYDEDNDKTVTCPKGSACGYCKVGQTKGIINKDNAPLDQDIELHIGEQLELDNGFLLSFDIQPQQGDVNFIFNLTDTHGNAHLQTVSVPSKYTIDQLNNKDDQNSLNAAQIIFNTVTPNIIITPDPQNAIATQQGKLVFFGHVGETTTRKTIIPRATITNLKPLVYDLSVLTNATEMANRYYTLDGQHSVVLMYSVSVIGTDSYTLNFYAINNTYGQGTLIGYLTNPDNINNIPEGDALITLIQSRILSSASVGPFVASPDNFEGQKVTLSDDEFAASVTIVGLPNMGQVVPKNLELNLHHTYNIKRDERANIAVFNARSTWADDNAGPYLDNGVLKWNIVNTGKEDASAVNIKVSVSVEGTIATNTIQLGQVKTENAKTLSITDFLPNGVSYDTLKSSGATITLQNKFSDDIPEDDETTYTIVKEHVMSVGDNTGTGFGASSGGSSHSGGGTPSGGSKNFGFGGGF